jgi:type I restriction enzyme S subunit
MKEKSKMLRVLAPKLRFSEFREGWRCLTVCDFFELGRNAEKTTTFDKDKVLTVKLHANGVVKNEKTTLTGGANYFIRRAGQFIYSKIDLLNGAFGIVPDALDGFYSSSDVPAYSFKAEQSSTFFVNWLEANYERLEIERTGTSCTLKRVSPDKFLALPVPTPTPAEQQKISNCLASLDERISAESQKLDAFKAHKKGLMQQLFPREGETVPRLRFPEFRDAGEWNKKKLSDLLFEQRQRNRQLKYGQQDVLSVSGDFGCVNQIELLGRSYAGANVKEYHVVRTGDIVYTKSPLKNNPYGIIKENKGRPGIVSTLYAVFRATEEVHPSYLDHYFSRDYNLNSYLQPLVNKGAKNDMKVNNSAVLCGEIHAPAIEEQKAIADFLSSLDELITAENQKLDALKTHKKGLMQQLFPVLDEVPA